ncbi:hypothetical protein EXM36_01910 [Clostridium botulinum]|uniref:helix-turn-helix domain-containing protein n=1 Tax=Clostridium botulinum TaxID=1491 RepID=UPI0013762A65|nr:helix-turn-helix domain-containing protein [Clostridium botulinum]MCC5417758.1 helix-turn-helix domain-containing protein [Clostridium botulinum]NCI18783.1 hypothetical protein [Clostridium botulinum]NCI34482.1 hypothetical protein [Clostridium botulinum]NCI73173.1 hypothetical protein [Clostridium botulinum]NDI37411.1 hypothetical protein [Clostridium botulinum]
MLRNPKQELQQVVKFAKKGDKKAKENILMRFKPFIKIYVRDEFPKTNNENDLIKIGMSAVLNAIQSYNINKNNFVEYVESLIKDSFKHKIRK